MIWSDTTARLGLQQAAALLLAAVCLLVTVGDAVQAQSSVPARPTGLTATTVSHNSVTLSWDDPGDSSIAGYRILRRDIVNQPPGTFTTIENNTGSAATTYTDNGVAAEKRYAYRIRAINSAGMSERSTYLNVETPEAQAPLQDPPGRPTGLTATTVAHESVTLTWDDPGDDSITGYQVLRRGIDSQAPGTFSTVEPDTGSAATTYTDTTVSPDTRYVYRVKAINPEGISGQSNYTSVETPASPRVPADPSDVRYFRVRGVNSKGTSDWATHLFMPLKAAVWSATMTVGENPFYQPSPLYVGYSVLAGAMSSAGFDDEGQQNAVISLAFSEEAQILNLVTREYLNAELVLRVGEEDFAVSGVDYEPMQISSGTYYTWNASGLGWSLGDEIEVSLLRAYVAPAVGLVIAGGAGLDSLTIEEGGFGQYGIVLAKQPTSDVTVIVRAGTGVTPSPTSVTFTPDNWNATQPVVVEASQDADAEDESVVIAHDVSEGSAPEYVSAPVPRVSITVRDDERENVPATGEPTISGTPEVGQTLTADTSEIADADGMAGAAFSYQWILYDGTAHTDIHGATDPTYTLVSDDEHMAFRVRVSFTDDAGFEESLTSEPYGSERPYGLSAWESDGAVVLTWELPVSWPYPKAHRGFQVLRNRPELGETKPLVHLRFSSAKATTYTDTDVEPGVLYVYRVRSVDALGYIGEASHPVQIRTAGLPLAPFNLTASANDDGSVTVSWEAHDDDSITGYQVIRRHPGQAQYSMVESVVHTGVAETIYTDVNPTQDLLHAYSVRAMNASGLSEQSNYDNVVPRQIVPGDNGMDAPTIYLTFDDGPQEPYTTQMMDVLEHYGARATFFVTGVGAALHPELIARMAAAGHGIGNHTWQHERLSILTSNQFKSTVSRTQEQISPHGSRCLRPPYGDIGTSGWGRAAALGLRVVSWNVDTVDYTSPGVEKLVADLTKKVSDGSIVLMHEHSGGGQTIEAVRIMLDRWARQGYQFKPVCEPPGIPVAPPNDPPSGAPMVSGPAQVGETLTSDVSGIEDGDGLSGASFSYQWFADNAEIENATRSSYLIAAAHEGKTIKLEVSFTDDAGNMHRIRSFPTAAVTEAERAAGAPEAPGGLSVAPTSSAGELSVTWNPPDDQSGPEITGYRVEWKLSSDYWGSESGVSVFRTTGTSHKITGLGEASLYAVRVRALSHELEGPAHPEIHASPIGPAPLFAEFRNIPAGHDGVGSRFIVEFSFSERTDSDPIEIRDEAMEVDGGLVLKAHRVGQSRHSWALEVLPSGNGHVTVALPASKDCSRWGAVCTESGKFLSGRAELTVPGPSAREVPTDGASEIKAPLTVKPWHAPESHNAVESFSFHILFSEPVAVSRQALEEHSFEVSHGTVTGARSVGGREDVWEITVSPAGEDDVTISLSVTTDCSSDGAVCTSDGRMLSNGMKLRVAAAPSVVEELIPQLGNTPATGPPTISGEARAGRALRASLSDLHDEVCLSLATFRFEWFADGTKIPWAADQIYVPDADDVGKIIRVKVNFTDDMGYRESLTSAPTAAVSARAD